MKKKQNNNVSVNTFLIAKLTIALLFITMIKASASLYSQTVRVNIDVRDAGLESVFEIIRQQSDLTFVYNLEDIADVTGITMNREDDSVENILTECLKGTGVTYELLDNVVILKKQRPQQPVQQTAVIITGTVLDSDGKPLAGAFVLVKGTQTAVPTDDNGKFSLRVADPANIMLVFSLIGMKTVEIAYTGQQNITVTLEEDVTEINQVVITGIFDRPRESYTGSAIRIAAEELKMAGNRSVVTMISNIDPSFNISENIEIGSDPNKLPSITIRGSTSLPTDLRDMQAAADNMRAANQPLVVMNGFEVSLQRMMDMDENMIESITLLKDASATALYGSRGSNGVIVITTKLPQSGSLRFTYRGNLNVEAPDLTSYNLMNAREKLTYEMLAGLYESTNAVMDLELKDLYNKRRLEMERGVDTYWLKYPVRVGIGSRHSIGIEGGENTFRYGANLSYNNIVGTMKGSVRNTFNGSLQFMYEVKNLAFKNDLQISINNASNSPYGTFSKYGETNSYWTPYDNDGNFQKILESSYYSNRTTNIYNPLYDAMLPGKNTSAYLQLQNNFSVDWKITSELIVRGQIGVSIMRDRSDNYISAENTMFDTYTGDNFGRKGRYTYGTGNSERYEGQLTINYSKVFNEVHQLYMGLGGNITEETSESYSLTAEGISMPEMDFLGAARQYIRDGRPGASENIFRSMGLVFNANYTYDRRYFADINGRMDGSSRFGSNRRMAPFWSGGIGWNIHQEGFFKSNNVVNTARLRLSYGVTGSQAFAPYLATSSYQDYGGLSYQNWYGAYLKALGNEDLGWQKTYQYNIGTEWQLFKSRFRLNLDFYNRLTKDLLTDINLPTAGGFRNYKANIGNVENKGFEVTATVFVLRGGSSRINWSIGGALAHNVNTIKKISNSLEAMNNELLDQQESTSTINPSFLFKEGESINTIYAVKSKGIDPGNGREIYIKADGSETYTWDPRDQVACGVTDPKFNGTINSTFRYKGINLSTYFSYRYGGQAYNTALANKVENIDPANNIDKRAMYDRWKNPGDVAFFKSVTDLSRTNATSRFVMDNNVFQFSSISLGYDFPTEWVKRSLFLEYLSITGYMEDIFHASTIKRERGLSYPFSHKFSISLTARF